MYYDIAMAAAAALGLCSDAITLYHAEISVTWGSQLSTCRLQVYSNTSVAMYGTVYRVACSH
jgi:hypothetical protein